MTDFCTIILDSYLKLLGELFEIRATDDGCLIVTPFGFSDGQPITIETINASNGKIRITDSGETINYLFSHGLNIAGRNIKQAFQTVAFHRGVYIEKEEIYVITEPDQLAQDFQKVLTAVQDVGYLIYKREFRGPTTFVDEVEKFLISHEISYYDRYEIEIKSKRYVFEFYVNDNKNALVQPVTAITSASALAKAERLAYRWMKVKLSQPKYNRIAIVDDIGKKAEIWVGDAFKTLQDDSDYLIKWSNNKELLKVLH